MRFSQVLDAMERDPETRDPESQAGSYHINPLATAAPPICGDTGTEAHAVEQWEEAMAWTADAGEKPVLPGSAASEATELVAEDLDLGVGLTLDELKIKRRQFLWSNHPDRCPNLPRDVANRRVAMANMLFDRAIRDRLRKPQP